CRRQRRDLIQQRLGQVLREARQSRLDGDELRRLVEAELKSLEREETKP
ncbi:MAG: hypothetical protein GX621_03755, partial [Pirellulaceae bacterium]|nr:hypothetical protein [Pirellulaceae bacterium]